MVRIGFICEGETEKIIVESDKFKKGLAKLNLQFVKAIDALGNGNLLPKYIKPFLHTLEREGAEKVLILTDLDESTSISLTKKRIDPGGRHTVVLSKRQVEAWFLADSQMLSSVFQTDYRFEFPEEAETPLETLREVFVKQTGRGIGASKVLVAKKMVGYGFDVFNAAKHENCSSAKYFADKLRQIGEGVI
jgi:predicted ATP-dependent endonuclease of OLD family